MNIEHELRYSPEPGELERKLAEAFPSEDLRDAARARLMRYGRQDWHREPERVRLAILKLAGSDLVAIDRRVAAAGVDYRDILAEAEYPAYSKLPPGIDSSSPAAQAAIRSDKQQFMDWINRR